MRIVFIGDSITDCGRDRDDEKSLGTGYVKVLSDKLHPLYPDTDLELINKGISGNELVDVLDRLQTDVIDLKPDAVVIMIGINNTLHRFSDDKEPDFVKFEADLISLFTRLKKAGIVVIFLEPFLLPAPDKRRMRKLFEEELKVIDRVAGEMADEFVPYDEMFQGLAESIPYTEYSEDGVHPTHRCSRLIANTAIKAIRKHLL
ncbi:MAG: SGNH/GDSL hydrolase family protein [Clostridia bacterium]|nr:SGNH/GDSL hydrolase family protein [Clostridia bacterium]